MSGTDLHGRTALVTGASGGIGAQITQTLLAAGAAVVGHYRTGRDEAQRAVAAPPGADVHLVGGDMSTAEGARAVWRAANAWRPVDVLVLNAATMADTPMDGSDEEWDASWEQLLAVNVIGSGALLREAVRSFASRGAGTAVVMSSWAGEQGSRILDAAGYAASKAAIRNLAQTLARHYARAGVRMYVVAPGVVSSGMGVAGQDDQSLRTVAEGLTMGRHVQAEEIAELVTFLASDACPSLTGATLDINGASYIR